MECIAYQITDLIELMRQDTGFDIPVIRVDGGPTANRYLMQFQSDIANVSVQIPELQDLSGMGAAYMAAISAGIYDPEHIYDHISHTSYTQKADAAEREKRYTGWRAAIQQVLTH